MLLLIFESNFVILFGMFYVSKIGNRFTIIGMFWRFLNTDKEFSLFSMEWFKGSTTKMNKFICI